MTPEQEAAQAEQIKTMSATLAALAPQLETLKTELASKDKVITDLQSNANLSTQERAVSALKAQFPDVPTETLMALPEAARAAQGKVLQESFGKLKSAASALKTGPDAWDNVGGVGPTAEAEDHAQLIEREKARDAAVQKGNPMEVLRLKARDTVEFLHKHYASR